MMSRVIALACYPIFVFWEVGLDNWANFHQQGAATIIASRPTVHANYLSIVGESRGGEKPKTEASLEKEQC